MLNRLLAFALLIPAATPQTPADYTICTPVPNGPITPDVSTRINRSIGGTAPVSPLA